MKRNTKVWLFGLIILAFLVPNLCRAMPPGTLLYRTTSEGKMFGFSSDTLIKIENGLMKDIYPGHVGIYIGQENGEDYVVEALAGGVVKTPAKYFINANAGEEFVGAKIPKQLSPLMRAKAIALAKNLAKQGLAYDFDFKKQKGPGSGEWTCVGLVEKIYESAGISNPSNLAALEYDPNYYALDITPDGFDNQSVFNKEGDCFSKEYEFSKIARRIKTLLPAPELIGYNAGLEYQGERYIFLPYTQFIQSTLEDVPLDIEISSDFSEAEIRGQVNAPRLLLRWSLINNPLSSLDRIARAIKNVGEKLAKSGDEIQISLDDQISNQTATKSSVTTKTKAKTTAEKTTTSSKTPSSLISTAQKSALAKEAAVKAIGSGQVNKTSNQKTSNLNTPSLQSTTTIKNIVAPVIASTSQIAVLKNVKTAVASSSKTSLVPWVGSYGYATSLNSNSSSSVTTSSFLPTGAALVNKIYSTGTNDWVQLFNPTDYPVDLATNNYRLEKAKTGEDPTLLIRFGNSEDGAYPGGTVVPAHGSYLIVSSGANEYYRQKAQAIAIKSEFSWSGSGYTLYLGVGAISSYNDPDIIDAVGFGANATYFEGSGPAPEITDNYILSRLSNTHQNNLDFNLISSDDPAVMATSTSSATSTTEIASSTSTIATSSDPVVDQATSTIVIDPIATSTEASSPATSSPLVGRAVINKIYSTQDNDWLELFNPTDYPLDLVAASYRLEKAKTTQDPSLLVRFGNLEDGQYPGGTTIAPLSSYLVVRDDANEYYRQRADAIISRDDFSWTGSGYTLYLGQDAISSSTDPDVIDLVGFGTDATFFEGAGPAPEITDNYILVRQEQSHNNQTDFSLVFTNDPGASQSTEETPNNLPVDAVTFDSPGLKQIWHFAECYGEGRWAVGRWDCAREVGFVYDHFVADLSSTLELENLSTNFYYKKGREDPRLIYHLNSSTGDRVSLILEPGMVTVEGLPNTQWRYHLNLPFEDVWHQATLVVNQPEDYWAVFIDGQEIIRESFFGRLGDVANLEITGDCGSFLIDELAIWERTLEAPEILAAYDAGLPFTPLITRPEQTAPVLSYFWEFEEDMGTVALDQVSSTTLAIWSNAWVGRAHNNYALRTDYNHKATANFSTPLISQDLSLAFWWRNSLYPEEGRANVYLTDQANNYLFALLAKYYSLSFWFNGNYGILAEGTNQAIPYDANWHHLALIYDSYQYKLTLYVDGVEKGSQYLIWMLPETAINHLEVSTDSDGSEIDDLQVWRGALNAAQVHEIYLNSQ